MTGAEMIVAERKRQIEKEGFDADHDGQQEYHELAWAAVCYAAPEPVYRCLTSGFCRGSITFTDPFPDWADDWDKREKHSEVRRLVIAGALIAAEIDRLLAQQDRR